MPVIKRKGVVSVGPKMVTPINDNFRNVFWLLGGNVDYLNLQDEGVLNRNIKSVSALKVEGMLEAGQVKVGGESTFEEGYDPTEKISTAEAGKLAYEDLVEKAKMGTTVIDGGYITTGLIDASRIDTGVLSADYIATDDIVVTNSIDIQDGQFVVTPSGWVGAAGGNFVIDPDADGVHNYYSPSETSSPAARWKRDDSNYLFQDADEFRVYRGGYTNFAVRASGTVDIYNRINADNDITSGRDLNADRHLNVGSNAYIDGILYMSGDAGQTISRSIITDVKVENDTVYKRRSSFDTRYGVIIDADPVGDWEEA